MKYLEQLYSARFNEEDLARKNQLWRVLCERFFQRLIDERDTVLDLGAGYCEFINNIRCANKKAVDLSSLSESYANSDVTVYEVPAADMAPIQDESIDVVFSSNFFEHLSNKQELFQVLQEIHRVLRVNGRLIVIMPNIRYAFREYWDFVDHHLPLSHLSLHEALVIQGYQVDTIIPRFLPYTTKNRLPQAPWMLRVYLDIPLLWRLFGKQMLVTAHKPFDRSTEVSPHEAIRSDSGS